MYYPTEYVVQFQSPETGYWGVRQVIKVEYLFSIKRRRFLWWKFEDRSILNYEAAIRAARRKARKCLIQIHPSYWPQWRIKENITRFDYHDEIWTHKIVWQGGVWDCKEDDNL
jgi:hypothetical protein